MKKEFVVSAVVLSLAAMTLAWIGSRATDGMWGQTVAAWVQAVGSVLAIAAAIWVADQQLRHSRDVARRDRSEAALAAVSLAAKALEQVADRLLAASAVGAGKKMGLALREHRTTELVQCLRELSLADLPTDTVATFSALRSRLYAVNARITEIYRSEESDNALEGRRFDRVKSSLLIYDGARDDYISLCDVLSTSHKLSPPLFKESPSLRMRVDRVKRSVSRRNGSSVSA